MATSSNTQGTNQIQWDESSIIQQHKENLRQNAIERGDEFIEDFYDNSNITRPGVSTDLEQDAQPEPENPGNKKESNDEMEDIIEEKKANALFEKSWSKPGDEYTWTKVASRIRRYKATINVKYVSGETLNQKVNVVLKRIDEMDHFMGIKVTTYQKEQYIVAEFGDKDALTKMCSLPIEENSEHMMKPIDNRGDEELINRTMIIRDLPLYFDKEILKRIVEKYSTTEVTDIKSRIQGPWSVANVTLKDAQGVENLKDIWSIPYLKDLCRIAPASFKKEDIEKRNEHELKLSNLPFGITAYDLKDVIIQSNAKIVFIPRSRDKYERARYAYVSFEKEEHLQDALMGDKQFELKGKRLYWIPTSLRTCHKCGSPDHIVRDCKERTDSFERKEKQGQYHKLYTRYRVPNYRKYQKYHETSVRRNRMDNEANQASFNNIQQVQKPIVEQNTDKGKNTDTQPEGNTNMEATAEKHSEQTMMNILLEIKKDVSNINDELQKLKSRVVVLEKKPETVNIQPDRDINRNNNPVNNRGIINYNNRNQGNTSRNYNNQYNYNGKRGAIGTDNQHSSSSDEENQYKARRANYYYDQKQQGFSPIPTQQPKTVDKKQEEIDEIKKSLEAANSKFDNLSTQLNKAMEIMLQQRNNSNNNASSSSASTIMNTNQ